MSTETRTFRNLDVWRHGLDIVLEAYRLVEHLPSSEKYELSSQIRRAATSIPANIAEGHARRGKRYVHHLGIALGSLAELETHIEVAVRLRYFKPGQIGAFTSEAERVGQMLHGLRRSVKRRLMTQVTAAGTVIMIALVIALL